jgi:lipoic acid synthetase
MRLPEWIKTRSSDLHIVKRVLRGFRLSTVCEEAKCPNKGICFSKPTATFMILGDICTRNCGFCAVKSGTPCSIDSDEPERVAEAAIEMGLRHVVITSVTRDDLVDGGATQFAETIKAVKSRLPQSKVEILTPDFKGNKDSLRVVLEAKPDIFNHNMETIKRLYPKIRPQADYERSLNVLKNAKKMFRHIKTKSGLMLGFGETIEEVIELLNDLREAECDFLTIGQYLRPSKKNLPVVEYIRPDVFEELKEIALKLGFEFVASGPLVRSSMNAEDFLTQ